MNQKMTYSCAVLLHRVRELVALGPAAGEKAVLTHVKTETFETPIPNKAHVTNVVITVALSCSFTIHAKESSKLYLMQMP